jgi:hypothetical protein
MTMNFAGGKQSDAPSQLPAKTFRQQGTILFLLLIFLLPAVINATSTPGEAIAATPTALATPSSSPTASVILFSPNAVVLNNPTGTGSTTPPQVSTMFTVDLTAYDSKGNILTPTAANPLHVHVYGAPDGVITPVDATITAGTTANFTTVKFTYSGGSFPNNMELAAWIKDPSGSGESLGTTLFVQQHQPPCTYGSRHFDLEMIATVPDAIKLKAVVGADKPTETDFGTFTIDTGSLGVLVTKKDLVIGPNVHGPGAAGQKFYDSSGFVFTGSYYLAPVSLELKDHGFVQTHPILVLAIDGVHCHTSYKNCVKPEHYDLHYLGVGFDRNSTEAGDLFDSPSENAFLELTDAKKGTDINQGYILSTAGVTLGITAADASGFNLLPLASNSKGVLGDWNPVPGCYQFTHLQGSPQFCGNLLLDVGIDEMFLDLPSSERPAKSYDSTNRVPAGVRMNIQVGLQGQPPVMRYDFRAVQPPQPPQEAAPKYVKWVDKTTKFVNTGRRPLLDFNYLYSGQCGQVGFEPLKNGRR